MKRLAFLGLVTVVLLSVMVAYASAVEVMTTEAMKEKIEKTEWVEVASWEINSEGQVIENGLHLFDPAGTAGEPRKQAQAVAHDGNWVIVQKFGEYGVETLEATSWYTYEYFYFDVDNSILHNTQNSQNVLFTVEYWTDAPGTLIVEYCSFWARYDQGKNRAVESNGQQDWMVYQTVIDNATFNNEQQTYYDAQSENRNIPKDVWGENPSRRIGVSDFRLTNWVKELHFTIKRVSISLEKK